MFGQLAKTYLRRRRGRYPTYRSVGLKRYAMTRIPVYRPRIRKARNSVFRAAFRMQLDNAGVANLVDALGNPIINTGDLNVKLQDFPQTAPFTRIYTQYKINKVKIEFIPTHTRDRNTGVTTGQNVPTFVSYVRRISDSTGLGSLQQAMSIPYAKQTNAGVYHKHYFSPVTYDNVYRPGLTTTAAQQPEYSQWFPVSYPDVEHHGVRWFMSQAGTAYVAKAFDYRVVVTIYCHFKLK